MSTSAPQASDLAQDQEQLVAVRVTLPGQNPAFVSIGEPVGQPHWFVRSTGHEIFMLLNYDAQRGFYPAGTRIELLDKEFNAEKNWLIE